MAHVNLISLCYGRINIELQYHIDITQKNLFVLLNRVNTQKKKKRKFKKSLQHVWILISNISKGKGKK